MIASVNMIQHLRSFGSHVSRFDSGARNRQRCRARSDIVVVGLAYLHDSRGASISPWQNKRGHQHSITNCVRVSHRDDHSNSFVKARNALYCCCRRQEK